MCVAVACLLASCDGSAERAAAARMRLAPEVLAGVLRASPLPELPADPSNAVADDPQAAELGRLLFYDSRFSGNGEVSCATCHDPELDWGDGEVMATGVRAFGVHTPSLWNVAHNRWFFWDGRADSLWAQAVQPWEHPDEMGGDRVSFARLLGSDMELGALYEAVFGELPDVGGWPRAARPGGGDLEDVAVLAWALMPRVRQAEATRVIVNMGKAVAAFERRIVTGETRFDRYVSGLSTGDAQELAALSAKELHGMELFFGAARCHLCHHGPLFTDLEFHDVRLPHELDEAGAPLREFGRWLGIERVLEDPLNGHGEFGDGGELGEGEVPSSSGSARGHLEYLLRSPHTKGEFKTPGLRGVARTAPYTHRGVYATLEEVVRHYSTLHDAPAKRHADIEEVLVAVPLDEDESAALVAFLHTLSSAPAGPELRAPGSR